MVVIILIISAAATAAVAFRLGCFFFSPPSALRLPRTKSPLHSVQVAFARLPLDVEDKDDEKRGGGRVFGCHPTPSPTPSNFYVCVITLLKS